MWSVNIANAQWATVMDCQCKGIGTLFSALEGVKHVVEGAVSAGGCGGDLTLQSTEHNCARGILRVNYSACSVVTVRKNSIRTSRRRSEM